MKRKILALACLIHLAGVMGVPLDKLLTRSSLVSLRQLVGSISVLAICTWMACLWGARQSFSRVESGQDRL